MVTCTCAPASPSVILQESSLTPHVPACPGRPSHSRLHFSSSKHHCPPKHPRLLQPGVIYPARVSLSCLSPPGPALLYGDCSSRLQGGHTCPCTIHLEMAVFPSYPGRNWSVAERGLMLEMTRLDGAPGSSGHRGEREGGNLNPATAQERSCQQQPLPTRLHTKTGLIFTTARARSTAFPLRLLKEPKG